MVNLDTHVLVYALAGDLTAKERRILSAERWGISAIVYWELAKLVQLQRISLDLTDREVVRVLSSLQVWPVDLGVSVQSTTRTSMPIRRTS